MLAELAAQQRLRKVAILKSTLEITLALLLASLLLLPQIRDPATGKHLFAVILQEYITRGY